MDPRPIGVFDSGLGGLTAVRQLRRVLPGEDIVYFGDTGRVPYGSRGRDTIVQYARQDIRFLLSRNVKFIIAACGTVSSTYPPEEAARLPVPYTGVVGATARAAVDATRNHRIGIIGTAATVRSGSYAAVIRDMLPDVQIFARACPMFVPLVENGYFNDGNPVTKLIIAEYLQELKDAGVDTLILGCTHYPLLKKMIGDFMGDAVRLVDSGKVTAQATAAALADLWALSGSGMPPVRPRASRSDGPKTLAAKVEPWGPPRLFAIRAVSQRSQPMPYIMICLFSAKTASLICMIKSEKFKQNVQISLGKLEVLPQVVYNKS